MTIAEHGGTNGLKCQMKSENAPVKRREPHFVRRTRDAWAFSSPFARCGTRAESPVRLTSFRASNGQGILQIHGADGIPEVRPVLRQTPPAPPYTIESGARARAFRGRHASPPQSHRHSTRCVGSIAKATARPPRDTSTRSPRPIRRLEPHPRGPFPRGACRVGSGQCRRRW